MRYIIIERDLGAFVGRYDYYAIFAKNEIFGADRVVSFENKKTAIDFVVSNLNAENRVFCVEGINCKSEYVTVIEIIKAGLGHHTHQMMENIQMVSETIH